MGKRVSGPTRRLTLSERSGTKRGRARPVAEPWVGSGAGGSGVGAGAAAAGGVAGAAAGVGAARRGAGGRWAVLGLAWVFAGRAGVAAVRGRFSAGVLRGWVAGAVPVVEPDVVAGAALVAGAAAGRGGGTVADWPSDDCASAATGIASPTISEKTVAALPMA